MGLHAFFWRSSFSMECHKGLNTCHIETKNQPWIEKEQCAGASSSSGAIWPPRGWCFFVHPSPSIQRTPKGRSRLGKTNAPASPDARCLTMPTIYRGTKWYASVLPEKHLPKMRPVAGRGKRWRCHQLLVRVGIWMDFLGERTCLTKLMYNVYIV